MTTALAPTANMITKVGDQDTTVTVMAMTISISPSSITMIKNTAPEPSETPEPLH